MKHELPKLPYAYDALEPYIDEQTMRIHHDKHHQAYVDKLNAALEPFPELQLKSADELLANLSALPENARAAIKNNAGGHVNHSFFWPLLKKDSLCSGEIKTAIEKDFGSFETFKAEFAKAALNQFGSGWAWLVIKNGKLAIMSTPNQDSPLSVMMTPLVAIDVWEHAYYLKYQNRRAEYIDAFFNIINWQTVNENLKKA